MTDLSQSLYRKWASFIDSVLDINFQVSKFHNRSHMKRVLSNSLIIGDYYDLGHRDMERLAIASSFHDSRRKNDGIDLGHGKRGADHYKEFSLKEGWEYDDVIYWTITYHDRNDQKGEEFFQQMENDHTGSHLIYQIFKDSDGLDRQRLGRKALNPDFLRTDKALEMIDFAYHVYQNDFFSYD